MPEADSGYMKGKSGWLFWLPAATLAVFFTLKDPLQTFQSVLTYPTVHSAAVLGSAAAWALALTVAWTASWVAIAAKTNRKPYAAAFLALALAALINFIPTAFGSYYVSYILSSKYIAAFPYTKVAAGASAAVCLTQAAAYCIFLFAGQGNAVIRVASALGLLCALTSMAVDLATLTGLLLRISPVLASVAASVSTACCNGAAFALLAATGSVCFGKPRGKAGTEPANAAASRAAG